MLSIRWRCLRCCRCCCGDGDGPLYVFVSVQQWTSSRSTMGLLKMLLRFQWFCSTWYLKYHYCNYSASIRTCCARSFCTYTHTTHSTVFYVKLYLRLFCLFVFFFLNSFTQSIRYHLLLPPSFFFFFIITISKNRQRLVSFILFDFYSKRFEVKTKRRAWILSASKKNKNKRLWTATNLIWYGQHSYVVKLEFGNVDAK